MSDIKKDKIKDSENKLSFRYSIPQSLQSLIQGDHRVYVVKKSERLASALYVVTGFMSHEEPMRKKLRSGALEIIGLSTRPSEMNLEVVESFKSLCVEMGVLLSTARGSGLLSDMNASLLSEEYALLATFVSKNAETLHEGQVLQFEELPPPKEVAVLKTIGQKSDVRKIDTPSKSYKRQSTDFVEQGVMSDRKSTILSLVDAKEKISIKDAVSLIPGVSEKTIQRELLAMVKEGVLVKEGERRWSTYRKPLLPSAVS